MTVVINHVQIKGVPELLSNLQRVDEHIRNDVALEAVQEGASVIQNRAMRNAPVRTAALRNSIRVESRRTGNGAEAEVGPHVIYGRILELGGFTGRGHRTYIKGKFYLSNAVKQTRGEVSRVMAATIQDYLGD